jgi:8-oxo-dGTP pyrophosphatase MutT (NUDIX family)
MLVSWESLPRKTSSSGALFFNSDGKFIITKPNYKEGWNVPGGTIDGGESPTEAFSREVKEELGLDKTPVSLLCVDYVKQSSTGHDHLSFVFDGGILTDVEIKNIKLQTEELDEYRFVTLEESQQLLAKNWARRIAKCIEARDGKKVFYLESGEKIS